MHLLTVFDRMERALKRADAPRRQMRGVQAWRADVAQATAAAAQFRQLAVGLYIDDTYRLSARGWARPANVAFVHGQRTHAAWTALSAAIISALGRQQVRAADLQVHYLSVAEKARRRRNTAGNPHQWAHWNQVMTTALAWAKAALAWNHAATAAIDTGHRLVEQENTIQQPVGHAIASVGGVTEVARQKRYHQTGAV